MNTLKIRIAQVLKDYPRARDDDNFLIGILYRNYYNAGNDSFYEMMTNFKAYELPSMDSVTRMRRLLQSQMPLVYGSSGRIRKERARLREEYKKEFGKHGGQ